MQILLHLISCHPYILKWDIFNVCGLCQGVFILPHLDNPMSKCRYGQLIETIRYQYLLIIYRILRLIETLWSILKMKIVYPVSGSHNFPQPLKANILIITRTKPQRVLHVIQNYILHDREKKTRILLTSSIK
jgi:hypothetical protein